MTLSPDTRLDHYAIEAPLGEGGMRVGAPLTVVLNWTAGLRL